MGIMDFLESQNFRNQKKLYDQGQRNARIARDQQAQRKSLLDDLNRSMSFFKVEQEKGFNLETGVSELAKILDEANLAQRLMVVAANSDEVDIAGVFGTIHWRLMLRYIKGSQEAEVDDFDRLSETGSLILSTITRDLAYLYKAVKGAGVDPIEFLEALEFRDWYEEEMFSWAERCFAGTEVTIDGKTMNYEDWYSKAEIAFETNNKKLNEWAMELK